MSNPYFRFKQFTVWHDQCAMKVNTDGVLLGAWVKSEDPGYILDIGAGTGLISLMLAQRFPNAMIHAVEINEKACRQTQSNIELSAWNARMEIFHRDFLEYMKACPVKYDLIVTNPPYFSNSLQNPDKSRKIARHSESLPFEKLITGVKQLLTDRGVFAVILPAGNVLFQQEAYINGLFCRRRLGVRSLPNKKISRQLLELSPASNKPAQTEELSIYQLPGEYSSGYINLTKDFYLGF